MDWHGAAGIQNVAFVISAKGEVLGSQTKNQLDPSEDELWVPGTQRTLFEVNGVRFGITICHEGFRYPESVTSLIDPDGKLTKVMVVLVC